MKKIFSLLNYIKTKGFFYTFKLVFERLFPPKIKNFKIYKNIFKNKKGIEIGGPSSIFRIKSLIPIYNIISSLDGVNFDTKTIWEGELKEGNNYKFENKIGYQYILDGTNLDKIPSKKYDFLLSSNNLEHIANPLKAVEEWLRVIKDEGYILLILPKKESNFDHKRDITRFEHLLDDYKNNIKEDDLTHLDEILESHDLSKDPLAGTFDQFKERSLKNYENRCLHHHIFDLELLDKIFNYFKIKVVDKYISESDFIILGKI